jgi:hypothetical protein
MENENEHNYAQITDQQFFEIFMNFAPVFLAAVALLSVTYFCGYDSSETRDVDQATAEATMNWVDLASQNHYIPEP